MAKPTPKPKATASAAPIIIVYGPSEDGRPRAGRFTNKDVSAAIKAAAAMEMKVFEAKDDHGRALAAKMPAGRLSKTGRGFVPYIRKELHEQLLTLVPKGDAKPTRYVAAVTKTDTATIKSPKLPLGWDKIEPGTLVIAQDDDPRDGWWQAVVVEAKGTMITLRWQNRTERKPFTRHRYNVALINPGQKSALTFKNDPTSKYPPTWAEIGAGHIVLAKEDGPMEQWWEATVVAMKADTATLTWRDYPALTELHRPRAALALIYPAPVAGKAKPA